VVAHFDRRVSITARAASRSQKHAIQERQTFGFFKVLRTIAGLWAVSQSPLVSASDSPLLNAENGIKSLRGTVSKDTPFEHRRLTASLETYGGYDCVSLQSGTFPEDNDCDVSWLFDTLSVSESDTYLNGVIPLKLAENTTLTTQCADFSVGGTNSSCGGLWEAMDACASLDSDPLEYKILGRYFGTTMPTAVQKTTRLLQYFQYKSQEDYNLGENERFACNLETIQNFIGIARNGAYLGIQSDLDAQASRTTALNATVVTNKDASEARDLALQFGIDAQASRTTSLNATVVANREDSEARDVVLQSGIDEQASRTTSLNATVVTNKDASEARDLALQFGIDEQVSRITTVNATVVANKHSQEDGDAAIAAIVTSNKADQISEDTAIRQELADKLDAFEQTLTSKMTEALKSSNSTGAIVEAIGSNLQSQIDANKDAVATQLLEQTESIAANKVSAESEAEAIRQEIESTRTEFDANIASRMAAVLESSDATEEIANAIGSNLQHQLDTEVDTRTSEDESIREELSRLNMGLLRNRDIKTEKPA
jgi:hypothetical protein